VQRFGSFAVQGVPERGLGALNFCSLTQIRRGRRDAAVEVEFPPQLGLLQVGVAF
jgi:hypothetical protein